MATHGKGLSVGVTRPGACVVSRAGGGKGAAELIWAMHSKRKELFFANIVDQMCCAGLTEGAH